MPSKRKELINPVRAFFAIVIVVIIWFAPVAKTPKQAAKTNKPAFLEYVASPRLILAVPEAEAGCPKQCEIQVCVDWDPTPCGSNPWDIGCCLAYDTGCNPECDTGGGGGTQPPTISHVLNCAQPGSNGWCKGNLSLDLTASDPQGSQVIISGDVNGTAFACPSGATTCFIPLPEGAGNANYKVDAAATGLSASGNTTYLLDSSTPQLNGSASGVVGTNGWYKSNVTLSVESSDVVSGIASTSVTVDGGLQTAYSAPIVLTDGIHTVVLTTTDNAGHVTQTTQTFNIDTVTPVLNVSLSGSVGANNWYISDVAITPSANDSDSGLASLEATMDGGPWAVVNSPLLFTDGIHSYQFRARDNAGNVTETAVQEIKVDATTPAISLKVNGMRGQNDWYVSDASVTPTATDATSGIATLEVSQDNSKFSNYQSPITFSDGVHSYQIRITDNAGNTTQIPMQQIKIDTVFPVIAMADELKLGETLYYDLEDPTTRSAQVSGLWINRQVIEDDAEKYKKVVWQEVISGNKVEGDILWDGIFVDGVKASAGEYFITLKILDAAGNETMRTAIVKVNALSFLQIIPPFTPPASMSALFPAQIAQTDSAAVTEFGGTNSGVTGAESASIIAGGTTVFHPDTEYVQSGFTQGTETTSTPISNSNILWGAAATAMLGATLADWQRKREEEEARKRAEATAQEKEESGSGRKTPGQRAYEAMMKQKHIVGESQALLNEKARERAEQAEAARRNLIAKNEDRAPVNMAKVNQLVEVQKKADLQAGLSAYYEGRRAREEDAKNEKPTWWERAVDWVDQHQVEISIGIGVAVSVAAIVLSGGTATPLIAAAWIAGAVAVAGGTVVAGTVGLNAYYDRPLGTNVVRNLFIAGGTAAVLTGTALLLAPWVSTTAASICTNYATACSQVGTIIDKGEEALLAGQITYYNWIGDQDNAAQAAIELQLEQMDGDAPGNTVAAELGEQLAKLGDDVPELIATYGDDIIPLLLKYQDDAVDIIGAYGEEGIALLQKFGDDAPQTIKLVREYGTPAVELLNKVDVESAGRVLKNPDAINALLRWKPEDFKQFGSELMLRAENDAKALTALDKLIKLNINSRDPAVRAEVNRLIQEIAENSTQGGGERFVLGNWVSHSDGYVADARVNGGIWYESHPDIYNKLEAVYGKGDPRIDEALWQINQAALQKQIEKGVDFDYSLTSIKSIDDYNKEIRYVELLESENVTEVLKRLGKKEGDSLPARLKEIQMLLDAGYTPNYDNDAHVIHWTLEP